jgi:hypothetical protein
MTIDSVSMIISVSSLLIGIALSLLAIGLSVYFFNKSSSAQGETSNSLTKINMQVDQLNSINDKILTRALTSISQIAKQKANPISADIQKQTAAALNAVATLQTQIIATGDKNISEGKTISVPGNEINGHNLPDLPDPFTLADLRGRYINILVQQANAMAWVNNYGQVALFSWRRSDGEPDSLTSETESNLDISANTYWEVKALLDKLRHEQPALFTSNPEADAALSSTSTRLDHLVRTHEETLEYYRNLET